MCHGSADQYVCLEIIFTYLLTMIITARNVDSSQQFRFFKPVYIFEGKKILYRDNEAYFAEHILILRFLFITSETGRQFCQILCNHCNQIHLK